MCSIPLKQFPSAAKESQVRSKSKIFKFHSLIAAQYCAYPGRGGEGILDQHTSAPWLLKHTLWYNGTSSWPLTFLPDKNPASLSPFVIPEQMKCSKSQTEPCLSAVIHICSLHYLPSHRHTSHPTVRDETCSSYNMCSGAAAQVLHNSHLPFLLHQTCFCF